MKAKINNIEVEGEASELAVFVKQLEIKKVEHTKVGRPMKQPNQQPVTYYKRKGSRRWTDGENIKCWAMHVRGMPPRKIAKDLGRTAASIRDRIFAIKAGKVLINKHGQA
jgi:hypothetical protein